eukprot:g3321.t1
MRRVRPKRRLQAVLAATVSCLVCAATLVRGDGYGGYGGDKTNEGWVEKPVAKKKKIVPTPTTDPGVHNFLRNPSIEQMVTGEDSWSVSPMWWQPFIQEYRMTTSEYVHSGEYALQFSVDGTGSWQGCGQLAYINQHRPADLLLTVFGKLVNVEGVVGVYADVRYQDGTALMDQTIIFGSGDQDWNQRGILLPAPKPIHVVMVYMVLENVYGYAFFDDFSLTESKQMPLSLLVSSSDVFQDGAPHWCVASAVCDTDNGPFHVINNFLAATQNPDKSDITLVTQLSADRLQRIQQIARVWKGPISAAVYATKKDNFEATRLILSLWQKSELVRTHVDIHLVTRDAYMADAPYPINMLRNVAWEHARTDQLFLLDVDFIPNPGMREYVKDLFPKLRRIKGLEKAAYVVPAFGASTIKKWPRDRPDLVRLINLKVVKPVHAAKLEAAHGATNYKRWYKTKNPFQILYELFFEPYVVVSKDMPRYDQRFSGYGHDKSSHIFDLYMQDYKFIVLPEAFVIHIEHGVPGWRNTANKTRIWVNWYSFALQKEEQYREFKSKSFFSGAWENSIVPSRDMPPTSHHLKALFSPGDMEIAREMALKLIDLKKRKEKLDFWENTVSKYSAAIRSLIRELVHRFHGHKDALKEPVGPHPTKIEIEKT